MMIVVPFLVNTLLSFAIGLLIAKGLGPSEYGRFALVFSISGLIQIVAFDWLRQATLRFYSDHDRDHTLRVRATLDKAFLIAFGLAAVCAGLVLAFGRDIPPSPELAALAVGLSMSNGAFDMAAALARARFLDRPYAKMVLGKNIFAVVLAVGGAFWAQSAAIAILGLIASSLGSLIPPYRALKDREASFDKARLDEVKKFAAYSAPIVISNLIYNFIPTLGRGLAAETLDYAEVGKWSLAFDLGVRIISAIGSSMDVILFQIAVARERTHGRESADAQIKRNASLVLAVLAPAVVGVWAVTPSFEALLVPSAYHGSFGYYYLLTAPALLVFGLINFAVNPAFQLEKRTAPMIFAAFTALAANFIALIVLPPTGDAGKYAIAQSLAACVGLSTLIGAMFVIPALRPMRAPLKDIVGVVAACAAMCAAIWPLRAYSPGFVTLTAQVVLAITVYGALAWAMNIAELRSLLGAAREKIGRRFF